MDSQNPMVNFFKNIRLPLHRGNFSVLEFLVTLYEKYVKEIEKLLSEKEMDSVFDPKVYDDIEKNKGIIELLCGSIIDILKLHSGGNIATAYNKFDKLMNKIDKYLLTQKIVSGNCFYRIRPVENKACEIDRKAIFHIPFDQVTKVKSYRYSIAGFPCLYLSSRPELCWMECGMPSRFFWSKFQADTILEVINFKESPFPFISNYYFYFINKHHLKYYEIITDTVKYILTYPLMAACSLITSERNNSFIPEYIIPQMLLLWLHNNSKLRGIAYFSSSNNDEAQAINAYNIVLAPVSVQPKGYCKQLIREFKLSRPQFCDVTEKLGVFKNKVEKLSEFRKNLYLNYVNKIGLHQIRELLSICDSFINLYWKIVNGQINDFQLIQQYLNTTILYSYNFTGKMKKVQQEMIIEELNNNHVYKGKQGIEELCFNILDEYEKLHFDVVISMWNIGSTLFLNSENESDDYEFIEENC